jgi:hypothetical protein
MARADGDTVTVWVTTYDLHGWTDPWGNDLPADVVHDTFDLTIAGTHHHDDGYGTYDATRAVDADGRPWFKPRAIDMVGSPGWRTVHKPTRWATDRFPRRRPVTPDGHPYPGTTVADTNTTEREKEATVPADTPATTTSLRDRLDEHQRLKRDLDTAISQVVTATFGENPYAGYFGWTWDYNADTGVVTIHPHTYGGPMDSQRQPLPRRTFHADDHDRVLAGEVEPDVHRA